VQTKEKQVFREDGIGRRITGRQFLSIANDSRKLKEKEHLKSKNVDEERKEDPKEEPRKERRKRKKCLLQDRFIRRKRIQYQAVFYDGIDVGEERKEEREEEPKKEESVEEAEPMEEREEEPMDPEEGLEDPEEGLQDPEEGLEDPEE